MKNLGLILFFILPLHLFSQRDTTWNHDIMESDLVLLVNIYHTGLFVDEGDIRGKILQVVKGNYSDTTFTIYFNFGEVSQERWEKRFRAIYRPPGNVAMWFKCYVGFTKDDKYHSSSIVETGTKEVYYFFMSEKQK